MPHDRLCALGAHHRRGQRDRRGLGGSAGHVTTSEGLKIVFAQDVHGPLHPSLLSDAADYQASLPRLIDLDADVLCEGHYGIYKGKQEIVGFVRSFMR